MALRALIFDVDGTLAETEEAHRVAFNAAFAEAGHGWSWDVDTYRDLLRVTGGQQRIRHFLDTIAHDTPPEVIAAIHARKNALYAGRMAAGDVALRPGIAKLIDEARRARLKLAIATTTSRANIEVLLTHLFAPETASWFDVIVAGEDVTTKKPHPEVYERTLKKLDLSAREVIAIEDSRNGLLAASACGITTVVTPSIYSAGEDVAGAALICEHLELLPVTIAALSDLLERRPLERNTSA